MYWTDWGTIPKIERSDLDGGNRQTIVRGDLKWPNGLVIDQASLRLFWADAGLDKIETSNLMVKHFPCFFLMLVKIQNLQAITSLQISKLHLNFLPNWLAYVFFYQGRAQWMVVIFAFQKLW